jgi:hypothetical protein
MCWHACAGTLPEAWGSNGAFPQLRVLAAKGNALQGPLPGSWGNSTAALPSLTILNLDANQLWGALPPSWAAGWRSLA